MAKLGLFIVTSQQKKKKINESFVDPVIFVSFLNQCCHTKVIERNLNPIWDQTLILDINFFGDLNLLQKHGCCVMLEVFDRDELVGV